MKRILVIVFSNLKHDARVRRQVDAIKQHYDVTIACFDAEPSSEYTIVRIHPVKLTIAKKLVTSILLLLRLFESAYRQLYFNRTIADLTQQSKFDLIIANDIETLPLAFQSQAQVLFDAHEYAPRHFEDRFMWRLFFQRFNTWICRQYIPRLAAMTTVGIGLANEYRKNFKCNPVVVTNANNYFDVKPSPANQQRIKLIHHGIATRSRQLELMIDMVNLLDDRFTLDLMLMVPGSASAKTKAYLDELKERAAGNNRIQFVPPVKSVDVVPFINQYDIGVFLLPPVNFNYAHTLPNKLFDFIQARLATAIGPTPEMAEIVKRFNNGVICDQFTAESLASKLNALTIEEINEFKMNSIAAAKELNAEANQKILRGIIESIFSSNKGVILPV